MKVVIVVTRKEGDPLEFRLPDDKWDLALTEGCLVVNERTGKMVSVPVVGGTREVEKARTLAIVPVWNLMAVEVKTPAGFTTG